MAKELHCPLCGVPLALSLPISRRAECPGCGRDLHACHSCRLHDPAVHNQCREVRSEWQGRRDRGNYCDFFELASPGTDAEGTSDQETARQQALDDLFKNF